MVEDRSKREQFGLSFSLLCLTSFACLRAAAISQGGAWLAAGDERRGGASGDGAAADPLRRTAV